MKSTDDYIRERAELAGITLTDHDLAVVREKWESDPRCAVDDLISGLRMLNDRYRPSLAFPYPSVSIRKS